MDADKVLELIRGKRVDEQTFRLILREYLHSNMISMLDYHSRKMSAKRSEFRKRKKALMEKEGREFISSCLDYNYEKEREAKYGPDWHRIIGYGEADES
jgi:hypothetical protein